MQIFGKTSPDAKIPSRQTNLSTNILYYFMLVLLSSIIIAFHTAFHYIWENRTFFSDGSRDTSKRFSPTSHVYHSVKQSARSVKS